ncbi:MAG: YdeI/OmpD-associated family protein [Ginsengibacter sp.]
MEITGKQYYAKDRKAWRNWLQKNHLKEPGVWLIYYKKDSGKTRVSWEDAVEEALCFGWIDSISKPIDEHKYAQRFTPRKIKSVWSALNKKRVEKLSEQKLMSPAGLAIIDAGKKNGSWEQLDHVENFVVPADLKNLFAKNKKVLKYFEALAKSSQKIWLYRLHNAKLPETKAKRMAELMAAATAVKKKNR